MFIPKDSLSSLDHYHLQDIPGDAHLHLRLLCQQVGGTLQELWGDICGLWWVAFKRRTLWVECIGGVEAETARIVTERGEKEVKMGKLYLIQLDGRIYRCRSCLSHLAQFDELVSKVPTSSRMLDKLRSNSLLTVTVLGNCLIADFASRGCWICSLGSLGQVLAVLGFCKELTSCLSFKLCGDCLSGFHTPRSG